MNMRITRLFAISLALFSISAIPILAENSINDLEGEVDEANNVIDSNNNQIAEEKAKIDELNSEIESLESDIDKIRTEFENNEDERKELVQKIKNKEQELVELNEDLEVRMDISSSLLTVLQRNKNINFIVEIIYDDEMSASEKLRTINSLNQLSIHSFKKLELTMELIEQVKQEKQELSVAKDNLEQKQEQLKAQGTELLEKSENQQELKQEALTAITTLEKENTSVKTEMLENSNLISDYEVAGCTGDDVYGVDCAVPASEDEDSDDVESSNNSGYVAKLKADPNANYIINRESNWNPSAQNPYSGAYGICQALPGSKMASAGSDWKTNIETQAKWCDSYVNGRYGSWSNARAFWDANHWF